MKDCKGQELSIGDSVVYVARKQSDAILQTGEITKFYKGKFNRDECSVGKQSHINSSRIMKI